MLARIASSCYVHRRRVVLVWLALIIVSVAAGSAFAGRWATSNSLPGTDSQAAANLLNRHFPAEAGEQDTVLFAPAGPHRAEIDTWLAHLGQERGVTRVESLQLAPHHDVAAATFFLADGPRDNSGAAATAIQRSVTGLQRKHIDVAFNGDSFETGSAPSSEVIGIVGALVVLLVVLGSVIAAGLPIVMALAAIGAAVPIIGLIAHAIPTANFTDEVATMIGLGVGIDYTLLVVTRFRTVLARLQGANHRLSAEPTGPGATTSPFAGTSSAGTSDAASLAAGQIRMAVIEAMTTAGRSVLIAGSTVVVSMAGLLLMGQDIYDGLAVGCALAVAVAVGATLTLLPALLGFAGRRIGKSKRGVTPNAGRLARLVQRRPAGLAGGGLLLLVLLASPVLGMHLANPDAGTTAPGSTTHQAYEMTSVGFGPGANGPIVIAADVARADRGALAALRSSLGGQPGVVAVSPATTSPDGQAAVISVTPEWSPSSQQTAHLIQRFRSDVIPAADHRLGLVTHVGGETASNVDFAHVTSQRLPWLVGGVLLISFLLLLVSFRSTPIASQAIVATLLSVGASYGVLVAVFQWGWGASLIGASAAPIAPWIPPMMFAIVFGLSMDYEVFLVGAIREARVVLGDGRAAVAHGLAGTAKIITAAATIMTLVFGSFVLSNELGLKTIGLGLAVAIVIDATVIRLLVVPAFLTMLGARAWWMPGRSGRNQVVPAPAAAAHTASARTAATTATPPCVASAPVTPAHAGPAHVTPAGRRRS